MTDSRRTATPSPLRVSLALLLTLLVATSCTAAGQPAAVRHADDAGYRAGTFLADPYDLPDQTLTDGTGRPYNLRTSPTKPVLLLFFGYVHCPDVCRAVLAEVATALQRSEAGVRQEDPGGVHHHRSGAGHPGGDPARTSTASTPGSSA